MQPLITVAIPTYNRACHVERLLNQIIEHKVTDVAEILVIDDGGSDGTYDKLMTNNAILQCGIKVLKNESNMGYSQTFVRLFAECKTEYIMIMADDDLLIIENLKPLIDFLIIKKPDFVSPQFLINNAIYRGKKESRKIQASEFQQCCGHAPGLIYKVSECKIGLKMLADRIKANSADALVYPQVLIVISLLMTEAKAYWLALPLALEAAGEPSGIRDANGSVYWSMESRWQQIKAFDDLFTDFLSSKSNDAVLAMQRVNRNRVFGWLVCPMEDERPELRLAFDSCARLFYFKQIIKKLILWNYLQSIFIFNKNV